MVPFTHEQNIICSKTCLDGTIEQTICRQLFAGHVVACRPMEGNKNLHRMIKLIAVVVVVVVVVVVAGGNDLSNDTHIRVIGSMAPEICTKMLSFAEKNSQTEQNFPRLHVATPCMVK